MGSTQGQVGEGFEKIELVKKVLAFAEVLAHMTLEGPFQLKQFFESLKMRFTEIQSQTGEHSN